MLVLDILGLFCTLNARNSAKVGRPARSALVLVLDIVGLFFTPIARSSAKVGRMAGSALLQASSIQPSVISS